MKTPARTRSQTESSAWALTVKEHLQGLFSLNALNAGPSRPFNNKILEGTQRRRSCILHKGTRSTQTFAIRRVLCRHFAASPYELWHLELGSYSLPPSGSWDCTFCAGLETTAMMTHLR